MRWLTVVFMVAICASTAMQWWLSRRQLAAVIAHRDQVPSPFAQQISSAEHRKAADYTIARVRFARVANVLNAVVVLALTVGGGIASLDGWWRGSGWTQPWLGVAVIASVAIVTSVIDLPLSLWRTFSLEARFGFNRTTPMLFLADLGKGLLLATLLGGPLVLGTLVLMGYAGRWWWAWVWCGWLGLSLLMAWAWPVLIAPLFNRFSPLQDATLGARIEGLLERCGFKSRGVFVVDSSRRSTHGNAYFTGIGRNKRIVFFDTLLQRLAPAEVEAVLAHELGHFRLHHVRQRLLVSACTGLVGLALLGALAARPAFYAALGVPVASAHAALLLFALGAPVLGFYATPILALWSRRHEFQADQFASRHASAAALATALVQLHRDNASTLTPDPLYAAFYYSHPTALQRIERLLASTRLPASSCDQASN